MVWAVEKIVVRVWVDCGAECVRVPVRSEVEYEVQEGVFVPESLSFDILYNRQLLKKRYPQLDVAEVEMAIRETVHTAILSHLGKLGLLRDSGGANENPVALEE